MNYRLVAYAGIMTALLGALFGWALSYIGRPDLDRLRYESNFYQTLNRSLPLIGAGFGLVAGSGFAIISQAQKKRDQNRSDWWS